jgi:hypothetical protein
MKPHIYSTIVLLITISVLSACGGGGGGGSTPPPPTDTTPPTVVTIQPGDLSEGRSVNAPVNAIFSEAMEATSISASSFTLAVTNGGTAVPGTVSYDPVTFKATFKPSTALAGNTGYTATVTTSVTDVAGNHLAANMVWSFITQLPTIRHFTSKNPANITSTLGDLVAVDPYTQATTSTPDVLVERLQGSKHVSLVSYLNTATFDNPNNNLMDQHRFAIAYATSAGTVTVKTVEQLTQGAPTTTTTFSNLNGITSGLGDGSGSATDLCRIFALTDYADINNSVIVVLQAGTDKICDSTDDTVKMVRYGDGASATVSTLPAGYNPQALIYDMGDTPVSASGALLGILAIYSDGNLYRLSGTGLATVDAVTGTALPTNVGEAQVLGYFGSSGNMVLRVDNTIRTYNVANNSISPSRATLAAANWLDAYTFASSSSGPSLYFADTTAGPATTIQTLDFNTSPPTPNNSFYTGGTAITKLDNTSGQVIFQDGSNVKSIAKTGGAATTLGTGYALQGVAQQTGTTPRVYLNAVGSLAARSVDDVGTNSVVINNARWLAGSSSTTYSFANSRRNLRNIILLTRTSTAVDDQGATLTNYDATTSIAGEALGSVPMGVTQFDSDPQVEIGGVPFLMQGTNADTSTDVYYADSFVANSLNSLGSDVNGMNDLPVHLTDFLDN